MEREMSEPQVRFLTLQRQRVLSMIGAMESTLAVLRAEVELLDRLIGGLIEERKA